MKAKNKNKNVLTFSRKLFLSVILLFLIFAGCFLLYQYQREKQFKIELLNTKLQDYNDRLYDKFKGSEIVCPDSVALYIGSHPIDGLRVTFIRADGTVLYDNRYDYSRMGNHRNRKEVVQALKSGTGYDINRLSESTGTNYFYSAKNYDNKYIIRSALPYDIDLAKSLKTDRRYIWFTLAVTLVLTILFYRFTKRLGATFSRLREFVLRADRDERIEAGRLADFPHNELGEISQHIIQIYKRLHETKEALYIEREKLITHLQISHEGLGIFNSRKKEILVNSLFTQYTNLISDQNLEKAEDVFSIPELVPVTGFINKWLSRPAGKEEKRMSVSIDKNGKTFTVECMIFQDSSFEISINDVTQEEEQARLKRQLTQNIAHELKTPVSSIQGYLETIVSNEDLPKEKMNLFLERCYAQSNRLSRLLRDISVLTRMDEASDMIEMEKVDITALVRNISGEVALELEERTMKIVNALPADTTVRGNYSLIYSIFRNLTDNAIAYAGPGVTVTVKCFREDENYYYFSFADTGAGVSAEHLNRLFERFYRVDKGRSRKLGGTGLGLAIVKNAVLLHGGNISAKANPGGGLEFLFTLSKG